MEREATGDGAMLFPVTTRGEPWLPDDITVLHIKIFSH
jgi:hypothetical protein